MKKTVFFILILTSISLLSDPIAEMIWTLHSKSNFVYFHTGSILGVEFAHAIEIPVFPVDPIIALTGCDPIFLKAMMRNESNFRVHATSLTGALGVSQIVRSTSKWLGVKNPYNPISSAFAMCKYIKYLSSKFKTKEEILWAYHDGESAVTKRGPSNAAKAYANAVLKFYNSYKSSNHMEWLKDRLILRGKVFYLFPDSYHASISGALSIFGTLDLEGGYVLSKKFIGTFAKIYFRVFHDLAAELFWEGDNYYLGLSMWDINRGMEVCMKGGEGVARFQMGDFGLEMNDGRFSAFYRVEF
jgi:hypothetical protein